VTIQKQGELLDEHVGWVERSETHPARAEGIGPKTGNAAVWRIGFAVALPIHFSIFFVPNRIVNAAAKRMTLGEPWKPRR
jgi:hypothetical protein